MTYTRSAAETYTATDIAIVMRRFRADLVMIAQSSGAITQEKAQGYAHDVELFAREGYLVFADVTLFDSDTEVEAARYTVDIAGALTDLDRPGNVMWPRVPDPVFRIVLRHTPEYDDRARQKLQGTLRNTWRPTNADIGHSSLTAADERQYFSNGWGLKRTDYRRRMS